MTNYTEYYEYLHQRSKLGLAYRNYLLYPRLNKYVSGDVLDIGCGIGDFLRFCPGSVGTDINTETVKWCQNQGLDVVQMEPDKLPFDVGSFDTIMMDNILEHIVQPENILSEIKRILREEGTLLVGVPGQRGYASDSDHKVFYTRALLESTLKSNGFKMTRVFGMPLDFESLGSRMRQYCNYGVFRKDD